MVVDVQNRMLLISWCLVSLLVRSSLSNLSNDQSLQTDTKCEPITAPLCTSIGYQNTIMPNLLGHREQKDAISGLNEVAPLLQYNCSQYLHLFVCSVFLPLCSVDTPTPVPVCRDLCEAVQSDCLPILRRLPFQWPQHLDCSKFPEPPTLCIQLPQQVSSSATLDDNNISTTIEPKCPERFTKSNSECVPLCGTDSFYRQSDKEFVQKWNAFWSWLAFASTMFTILTFFLDPGRLQYPEKPIVYIALSRLCITIPPIVKHFIDSHSIICADDHLIVNSSVDNSICTLTAIVTLYFNLASTAWFLVFCIGWYLSAAKNWSSESIQNLSNIFHGIVWSSPILPTILTVIKHQISADELTGLCQINEPNNLWFAAIPNAAVVSLSFLLTYYTALALTKVRRTVKVVYKSSAKLEKLMVRLLVFSAMQIFPTIAIIFCIFHETWHRPRWKSLSLLSAFDCQAQVDCIPGPIYRSAAIEVVMLKIFASMMIAINSGMWIWSTKTFKYWFHFIRFSSFSRSADSEVPVVHL